MNNIYKFFSYYDVFKTNTNLGREDNVASTSTNCVEINMTFMQVLPQSFSIPDFIRNEDKDSYFVMFGFSLQFVENDNGIEFRKFRFSILGTDTSSSDISRYKNYPLNYSFKQFIQDNYLNFIKNKSDFSFENKNYTITLEDQKTIIEGAAYLDVIFPNEKEICIINQVNADFYQGEGFNEGIYLYEKSTTLQQMRALEEKFPDKQQASVTKKKKI